MDTTHTHSRIVSLAAIMLLLACTNGWAWISDSTKKKEVSETFSVNTGDILRLDNKYGNIAIAHWDKNEVAIQVVVESKAGSESQAQEGLDRVSIDLSKTGNTISGITSLRSQSGRSNSNNRLIINYYVRMPSNLAINVSQKYGNINLPEQNEGKTSLEVKYGNVNGGSFTSSLTVNGGYSNINLEDVQDILMDLAYCGSVSFGKGNKIKLDSKYSNVKMGDVVSLSLIKKYGNISVKKVETVDMDIKYSEASIARVTEEISVGSLDYSTLKVEELDSNFKKVSVNARYGNFNISLPAKASFTVNAERMKYGSIDVKNFNITHSNVENKVNYNYQINGGGKTIYFNGNNYSNLRIKTY